MKSIESAQFVGPETPSPERCRQLENQITELAAHIHAATYRLLELIYEFDQANGWSGPGLASCAHWLNWKCGINLGTAREKVRVARALQALPEVSAEFRRGEISYSKVRAITRVATAENEQQLLQIARHGTAAHVERVVRGFRKVQRIEALEHENQRHALRSLQWHTDESGSLVVRGRFTPEQGAVLVKALERVMEQEWQEQQNVSAETPVDELRPRSEPIAQRRADALVRMAQSCPAETTGGDAFLVHVHTDMETLRNDGTGAEAELETGGHVSAETSRRLCCDASVVHWLNDHDGQVLSIGRKSRSVPPSIRRALQRRDKGCRFPGCTCNRFVDAHHVRHWADGGETRLDNLVLLCRRHHRLVHEDGFGVHPGADGEFVFTDPDGKMLPQAASSRFRGNVLTLTHENHREGLNITPRTGECRWLGEELDVALAIEGLCRGQRPADHEKNRPLMYPG
jgi:hypothetical protein